MRKTFQLRPEGRNPDRVLEAVKHEIRKYIKRERRRELPPGVDYWDFDCRFGTSEAEAATVHMNEFTGLIDAIAKAAGPQIYVEILAKHGQFAPRQAPASQDSPAES